MDNPLIVHIADWEALPSLVAEIPDIARKLADAYWPGPLTMIFKKGECIPDEVSAGLSTVAVRMPSHPAARAIIRASGCPLAAPSANRSGIPSPTTVAHVLADMEGRIAAVVDGGECRVGVESTVVDLSGPTPRLLRPGGVTPEMLGKVAGLIEIDPAVTHALKEGAVAASPGMKYKHYAPKAKVVLIKGAMRHILPMSMKTPATRWLPYALRSRRPAFGFRRWSMEARRIPHPRPTACLTLCAAWMSWAYRPPMPPARLKTGWAWQCTTACCGPRAFRW